MPSIGCYRFSRFELDLDRGCLREGDREIKVRPKAFVVLRHLVEQAGRLVSKDELMAAAWPDVHVSDASLAQCIREIRQALDDGDQVCIKTVPGRGYLLAAPVARVEPAPLTGASTPRPIVRPRGRVGAGVAVSVCCGAAIGALAVLWLDGVPATVSSVSVAVRTDDAQTELAYWQTVQASGDPRDAQSYLDHYPKGTFAALARNRLRAVEDSARTRESQQADEAQRQADAQAAEQRRAIVAERQAATLERRTQAEAARRRAEAGRVAALEAEVKRLGAAAAASPSAAPPPVSVSQAVPLPTGAPQRALGAPDANLEGRWVGELGIWRFDFTVGAGEIHGSLSCGNAIYRLRKAFGGHAVDITANRVTGRGEFPTTIGVKGDFPTLRLQPISAPPPNCNGTQPFELRLVSAG